MRVRTPSIAFAQPGASWWLGHAAGPLSRGACVVAGLLTLALWAWQGTEWQQQHERIVEQREQLMAQRAQLQTLPAQAPARPRLGPAAMARHNLAAGQLNAPWSDIFDGLERHAYGDVGLTMLEPDTKKGVLNVQAEAKEIGHLIGFASELAADESFGQLQLQQHVTNDQDSNRPVRLSFSVRLAPRIAQQEKQP